MDTSEPKIHIWLVVSTPLKHISRLGVLFPYKYKYIYIYNIWKNMFQTTNQTSSLMPSGIFWDTRTHLPSSHLSHTMKAHINAKLSCAKLESKQRTSEFGDRCSCEVYLLMGFLGSCSHLGETIIYLIYTSCIYIYLMIYIYHLIYTYIWTMYRTISITHQKIINQQGFMAHSPAFWISVKVKTRLSTN